MLWFSFASFIVPYAELAPVVRTVKHVATRSVNLLAFAHATMLSPLSTNILCMLLLAWLAPYMTSNISHHGGKLHIPKKLLMRLAN